jgi:hypothetical protein
MTLPAGPRSTDQARIDPLVVVVNNMSWSLVVAPVGISPLQLSVTAIGGITFWHNVVVRDRTRAISSRQGALSGRCRASTILRRR